MGWTKGACSGPAGGGSSCGLRGLSVSQPGQLYWGNRSKISPPGSAFRRPVLGDPIRLHEEIELSIYIHLGCFREVAPSPEPAGLGMTGSGKMWVAS